jgi:sialic acid synthase SpsE
MTIKINKNLKIDNNSRTLIIAEISANHCGSKKNFLKHILKAKQNGADLVKIQTYEPKDMVVDKKFKIKSGLWKNKNLWKLYESAQTKFEWHYDAFKLAKKNKIELFSTPFSLRGIKFLKKFKPKLYKVSSFEITDHNLINEIAKTKKPILLSTGLSNVKEILSAIKIIKKHHNKIVVLYCVSGYPTPINEIDFDKIKKLKKKLGINIVGFSDHTQGIDASLISLNYGVKIIERHFTINKKSSSPDVKFSIGTEELKNLKKFTESFQVIQNKKKIKTKSEKPSQIFRRSIYAINDIKKNEIFTRNNIACFRPKIGISSDQYLKIIGKKSKFNFKKNQVLKKI